VLECTAFATEEAAFAVREVRAGLRASIRGRMGDGLYGTMVTDRTTFQTTLQVVDVTSGSLREYPMPDSYRVTEAPFWVTADEIAVPIVVAATGERTVFRIQLAAFEAVP
jgi:hypothetical protein